MRNSIQLAYQMNDYIMWRDLYWRKDARVALAEIDANGSMTFTASPFPAYVERVSTMAMVVDGDKVTLVSRPIDGTVNPLPYLGFNLISFDYSTGLWDPAFVKLGHFGYLTGAVPVVGRNQPLFALLPNDAEIHNMAFVDDPTPMEPSSNTGGTRAGAG